MASNQQQSGVSCLLNRLRGQTLQGLLAWLVARGEAGTRGAQLLRLLLEADALDGIAASLSRLLQTSQPACTPEWPPADALSLARRACLQAHAQQPRSAGCSPQKSPSCALSTQGSKSYSGFHHPSGAISAPGTPRAGAAHRDPRLDDPTPKPTVEGGLRWHVAVDAARRQGFMAVADEEAAAVLACVLAPAAAGLTMAARSIQEELQAADLTPEVSHAQSWPALLTSFVPFHRCLDAV